ncbi:MAG TPA: hypothetical protein VEB64_09550 [Azospirillaceae bacterium]|nr:hypothetical protein [Azospirillaceae bacterium]
MDQDVAIGVLECRRAELVAELAAIEKHRARLRADLRHIDGALAQIIGHPQRQPWLTNLPRPTGPLPRPARIDRWFKGQEFSRAILDALRQAGGASTGQLARAVCEGRAVPVWAVPVVTRAAEKTLRRFARRGVVEMTGAGLWRAG